MKQLDFFDNEEEKLIDHFFANQEDNIIHAIIALSINNYRELFEANAGLSREICSDIKNMLRGDDAVVQLKDEEYIVLIKKPNAISDIEMIADKILKLVSNREICNNSSISVSAGISVFPFHGTAYADLKIKAYQAMYRSKATTGCGYRIYDNAFTKAMFNEFACTGHYIKDYNYNAINIPDWDMYFRETCFSLLYNDNDALSAANSIMEIFCLYYGFTSAAMVTTTERDDHEMSKMFFNLPGYEHKAESNAAMLSLKADMAVRLIEKYGELSFVNINEDLDEAVKWYMEDRNAKQLLCYAIRKSGKLIGAAIFENAESIPSRINKEDLYMLHEQMSMIQSYLFMALYTNNKKNYFSKIELIDNMDSKAYIIDAKSFELEYINKKALSHTSASNLGSKCYSVLHGEGKPCEDCPLLSMDQNSFRACGRNESYNLVSNSWDVNMFSWFSGKDNKGKALVVSVDIENIFGE